MDASSRSRAAERAARAKVFKALADPRRLEILDVLAESGEMSGTELADRVGISVALLSHHCKILFDAGFLERRQEGQCKYCSLDFVRLREATQCWLSPMPVVKGVTAPPAVHPDAVCGDKAKAKRRRRPPLPPSPR